MKRTIASLKKLLAVLLAFCLMAPLCAVSAEASYKIAFLGNTMLENELETPYPERLKEYFAERLGGNVETISAKPIDLDADDFLNNLVEDVMPQNPDIVFLELDISKHYRVSQDDITARLESMVLTMTEGEKIPAIYFMYYPEETMVDGREPFDRVAQRYGITVIDAFKYLKSQFESGKLTTRAFLTAGIIPSEEGHMHIARIVQNELNNLDNILIKPKTDVSPVSGLRYGVAEVPGAETELKTDGLVLYVAKNGNSNATGTIDNPLSSVEEAQRRIRATRKKQGEAFEGATVYIREGIYTFPNSLTFTPNDSGTDTAGIVYEAYNGEKVRFTNGTRLNQKAFTQVTDKKVLSRLHSDALGNVLQYDLKGNGIEYGECFLRTSGSDFVTGNMTSYADWFVGNILTVDGVAQNRARFPNGGWNIIADHQDDGTTHFAYSGDAPERWNTHSGQAFVRQISSAGYWHWFSRFTGTDVENKYLNVEAKGATPKAGWFWSIVNLLEELDVPGEWCVEEKTGILYYYPRDNFENAEILFSGNPNPIIKMDRAKNVTIKGITITCSSGSGVEINDGYGNRVIDCTLSDIGHCGVSINHSGEPGPGNNGVIGCHVYNTAKAGVSMIGGDKKSLIPQNDYVYNCHFENASAYGKHETAAVFVRDAVGTYTAHCLFHNAEGSAIEISGTDQHIEYNEFCNLVKETDDSAALYSQYNGYTDQGLRYAYNYMHDIIDTLHGPGHASVMGVYSDATHGCGVRMDNNVFENTTQSIFHNMAKNQTIAGNLFINPLGGRAIFTADGIYSGQSHLANQQAIKTLVEKDELENYRGVVIDSGTDIYGGRLYYFTIAYTANKDFAGDNAKNYFLRFPWLERYLDLDEPFGRTDALIRTNAFFGFEDAYGILSDGDDSDTYKWDNFFYRGSLPEAETPEEKRERINWAMKVTAENNPDFEAWDINKAGLLDEAKPVGDFELTAPRNGKTEVDPTDAHFSWDYASGADEYRVIIATDAEFKDVVFDDVTTNNYITVTNLKAGTRQYYWKVIASSQSTSFTGSPEAKNGPYMFYTKRSVELDKAGLSELIATVSSELENFEEGTGAGQYKVGTKAGIEAVYNNAVAVCESIRSEQKDINNAEAALRNVYIDSIYKKNPAPIEAVDVFTKTKDLIYVNANNGVEEASGSNQFFVKEQSFTVKGRHSVYTKEKFNSNTVLQLTGTFDFGLSTTPWAIIGLNCLNYNYAPWSSPSYVVLIRNNVIELQAFKPHVLDEGAIYESVPNTYIKEGVPCNLEFCAVPYNSGVRLILRIDGEIIFDYVDYTNPMYQGGYLQMHTLGDQAVMTVEKYNQDKDYPTLCELLLDPESELYKEQ